MSPVFAYWYLEYLTSVKNKTMITRFVLQQFAAANKLSLATERDVMMTMAKYINYHSIFN